MRRLPRSHTHLHAWRLHRAMQPHRGGRARAVLLRQRHLPPGTGDTLCGMDGGACTDCTGNASGSRCVDERCTTRCDPAHPCNGGCCDSPDGGVGTYRAGNQLSRCVDGGVCVACGRDGVLRRGLRDLMWHGRQPLQRRVLHQR